MCLQVRFIKIFRGEKAVNFLLRNSENLVSHETKNIIFQYWDTLFGAGNYHFFNDENGHKSLNLMKPVEISNFPTWMIFNLLNKFFWFYNLQFKIERSFTTTFMQYLTFIDTRIYCIYLFSFSENCTAFLFKFFTEGNKIRIYKH